MLCIKDWVLSIQSSQRVPANDINKKSQTYKAAVAVLIACSPGNYKDQGSRP